MARRRTTTRHTRVIRFLVFLLFLFLRLVVRAEGAGELVGGAVGGVGAGDHFDGMADGCVGLYKWGGYLWILEVKSPGFS